MAQPIDVVKALRDPDQGGGAGERHLASGQQRLRLVREPEQLVEIGPLLAILNTGVRDGADSGAPTPDFGGRRAGARQSRRREVDG